MIGTLIGFILITIDGGGGESQANPYILVGTLGQADIGLLSGGGFTLSGGFWWDGATMLSKVFLSLLLRNIHSTRFVGQIFKFVL